MVGKTAYIICGYRTTGGSYMPYQIGTILEEVFGYTCVVADDVQPKSHNTVWTHKKNYPQITFAAMEEAVCDDDIVVCNDYDSVHMFGPRIKGRKLMYVQAFTVFKVLDTFFDGYVSTSEYVQDYLNKYFDVKAPVIAPFIHLENIPATKPWQARPEKRILVYVKHQKYHPMFLMFQRLLAANYPHVDVSFTVIGPERIPHERMLQHLSEHRYFLWLTPCEGFGLPPLEAMACGTTILGFHGFGGLHYMADGENCAVAAYPNMKAVVDKTAAVLQNDELAHSMAEKGKLTAARFGFDAFRESWVGYLKQFIGNKNG
jgi:glycosyltransferase involved in cell wall biosynthesis